MIFDDRCRVGAFQQPIGAEMLVVTIASHIRDVTAATAAPYRPASAYDND